MIKSKADYTRYLEADKRELHVSDSFRDRFFHEIWNYQKLLRRLEYYINCRHDLFGRIYCLYLRFRFKSASIRLGFSISPNSCGAGLSLGHYGDIVINGKARLGANCTVAGAGSLIGEHLLSGEAPIIGDNCYIGAGAKVIGGVRIAEGVTIAANAVVTRDVTESYITVGGIPAVKISDYSIESLWRKNETK
jgi:serine O-acetyltransferase